jgi:hypothetical protein
MLRKHQTAKNRFKGLHGWGIEGFGKYFVVQI